MRFWSCSAIPIVAGHFVLLSMCWEIKLFYIYTFCFLFASLWMCWTREQAVPKQFCPLRLTGPRFVRMLFLYSVLDGSMTSGNRNELCSILTLWQLDVTTETDSVNLKYVDLSLVRMNFMPHSHSHGLFSRCAVVIAVSVWLIHNEGSDCWRCTWVEQGLSFIQLWSVCSRHSCKDGMWEKEKGTT